MADKTLILAPSVDLDTTPVVTDPISIEGFGQLALEIATGTMVGALKIIVELSRDGSGFFPETSEDTSGTSVSGDLEVPISRVIRTFDASDAVASVTIPCAGFTHVRCQIYAGTSGNASVWLTKLRLASN